MTTGGFGQTAVDAGHKVSWFFLEHLGALVRRHGAGDTTSRAIKRIMRADVIVTMTSVCSPSPPRPAKRSTALSTPPTRTLHRTVPELTAGDSIRLTQATAGKGVTPLTR